MESLLRYAINLYTVMVVMPSFPKQQQHKSKQKTLVKNAIWQYPQEINAEGVRGSTPGLRISLNLLIPLQFKMSRLKL